MAVIPATDNQGADTIAVLRPLSAFFCGQHHLQLGGRLYG
jgi:hypothetical protein